MDRSVRRWRRDLRFGRGQPSMSSVNPNARRPEKPASPELHTTLDNINDQFQSPLFDGTIPPEIRDCIFSYAFTDDLDITKPYQEDTFYTRPGHTHSRKISISLLMTCKRIYQETYHLPLLMKTHSFAFEQRHTKPPQWIFDPDTYFTNLLPTQLVFLQSFHFFVQQFWLEGSFFELCQQDVLKHLVHLKITLRRSDWWRWEDDTPPAITPYKPFPPTRIRSDDTKVMKEMWEEEKQNPSLKREFDPKYWGSGFQHLPKLKSLTMEFETEKSWEANLDAVAEHAAKGWKFPMGDRGILSAEGSEIEKSEWEGPLCMLSYSQEPAPVREAGGEPLLASEVEDPKKPILVVRSVRWKLITT